MKVRMNEKGFITNRVGKDVRMAVHEDGAKLKAKQNYCEASKKEDCIHVKSTKGPFVNKPWVIKELKDVKDDDK